MKKAKNKTVKKFNPELPPPSLEDLRLELEQVFKSFKEKSIALSSLGFSVYPQANDTIYLEKIEPAKVVQTVGVKYVPEKK